MMIIVIYTTGDPPRQGNYRSVCMVATLYTLFLLFRDLQQTLQKQVSGQSLKVRNSGCHVAEAWRFAELIAV